MNEHDYTYDLDAEEVRMLMAIEMAEEEPTASHFLAKAKAYAKLKASLPFMFPDGDENNPIALPNGGLRIVYTDPRAKARGKPPKQA